MSGLAFGFVALLQSCAWCSNLIDSVAVTGKFTSNTGIPAQFPIPLNKVCVGHNVM